MTGEDLDVYADNLTILGRRIAATLRTDIPAAHRMLATIDPQHLPALVCVLAAMLQPGPVDPWWQRTSHTDELAHRRNILIGEAA